MEKSEIIENEQNKNTLSDYDVDSNSDDESITIDTDAFDSNIDSEPDTIDNEDEIEPSELEDISVAENTDISTNLQPTAMSILEDVDEIDYEFN